MAGRLRFLQENNIVEGFLPVNLATGNQTGDWISMSKYNHATVCFYGAVGSTGDDPTITLLQATTNTGAGSKALNFTDIYRKQAATNLTGTTVFTHTTQAAGNTYTNATAAEQALLWCIEIDATDLDVSNNFDFIQANVADVGANIQEGCSWIILSEARYKEEILPTALS